MILLTILHCGDCVRLISDFTVFLKLFLPSHEAPGQSETDPEH